MGDMGAMGVVWGMGFIWGLGDIGDIGGPRGALGGLGVMGAIWGRLLGLRGHLGPRHSRPFGAVGRTHADTRGERGAL